VIVAGNADFCPDYLERVGEGAENYLSMAFTNEVADDPAGLIAAILILSTKSWGGSGQGPDRLTICSRNAPKR